MRRRYPVAAHIIYIALAILCLVIILSFGLDWGTRHGKSIVVPNFVGMDISEAEREAERMDLRIVVQDSIFDSDVAGGVVVEQLPRHGDKRSVEVKPGRKIYLTINAYNRRMVTVPYVAKQSLRQAKNQLERAGLTIRELIYEPDMVATDYVLREEINGRQIMATSTPVSVPYGTGVTLYVSYQSGRASRVVPKLIGMRLSQAQSTLWDNGLNVGKIEYDASVKDFKDRREAKVYKQSGRTPRCARIAMADRRRRVRKQACQSLRGRSASLRAAATPRGSGAGRLDSTRQDRRVAHEGAVEPTCRVICCRRSSI